MTCPECDDLHGFLRVLVRAARHPRITKRELGDAAAAILVDATTPQRAAEVLERWMAGRSGTRPPARRGVAS